MSAIAGLHHVTAIAADPQRNLDFYTGTLGLRMVKLTVNFDDPGSYHFYFADHAGSPGSVLTFFPWPLAKRGRQGSGFTAATAFRAAPGTLEAWLTRVQAHRPRTIIERFGQRVLPFEDSDGMPLEIIEDPTVTGDPASLHGFHSVTLDSREPAATARLLTQSMGYKEIASDGSRTRFAAAGAQSGAPTGIDAQGQYIDVLAPTGNPAGKLGAGVVHHIAFRARSDQEQAQWQSTLSAAGQHVTPVQDRSYFRSIYFREDGQVLFEIATDQPGFATDETLDTLGTSLKLPAVYEDSRATIEAHLPKIKLPGRS